MTRLSLSARTAAAGAASARTPRNNAAGIRALMIGSLSAIRGPSRRQIFRKFLFDGQCVAGEAGGNERRHAAGIGIVDAAAQGVDERIRGRLTRARIDKRLTIAPPPLRRSTGAKARHMASVPR